jgi:hypothetical protein
MLKAIVGILFSIKGDFQRLFFYKELEELSGKSLRKLITLIVILTLTLISLGFAIGGTKYLEKKMSDPFTNWVNLNVKPKDYAEVPKIMASLATEELKTRFNLRNVKEYNRGFVSVYFSDGATGYQTYRSIDPNDELIKVILDKSKKNVVKGASYNAKTDEFSEDINKCGIIIKEEVLTVLGFDPTDILHLSIADVDKVLHFPIISIVKEMPNNCQVMMSTHLYNLIWELSYTESGFINTAASHDFSVMIKDSLSLSNDEIEEKIKEGLNPDGSMFFDHEPFYFKKGKENTVTKIFMPHEYDLDGLDSLFEEIQSFIPGTKRFYEYECEIGNYNSIDQPYYLSFNFNRLDSVRSFQAYMKENHDIEISMSQIESKESFALLSKLTAFLSAILFGFSLMSIVFYINSLLSSHLEKIKMNLGTFKAFGLSNKLLVSTYLKIIGYYILKAVIIALLFCAATELITKYFWEKDYFDVFNVVILIAIAVIALISMLTSRNTIYKYLLKTPGDLIYNR